MNATITENTSKVNFDFDKIIERIFLKIPESLVGEVSVYDFDGLVDFRIDRKLKIRKASGIVAIPGDEDNKDFVPPSHYAFGVEDICLYADLCLEVELPNPATEMELYVNVRAKVLKEFEKRAEKILKKLEKRVGK